MYGGGLLLGEVCMLEGGEEGWFDEGGEVRWDEVEDSWEELRLGWEGR